MFGSEEVTTFLELDPAKLFAPPERPALKLIRGDHVSCVRTSRSNLTPPPKPWGESERR